MAKNEEIPKTNPAEIENLIEQIRATNLEQSSKDKIERLLRTVLNAEEMAFVSDKLPISTSAPVEKQLFPLSTRCPNSK